MNTQLPKSLWRFYFKFAARGYIVALIIWALAAMVTAADRILHPLVQGWIVGLFENPVPAGVNFLAFAMPTIILVTVLNIIVTSSVTIQMWIMNHLQPKIDRRVSELLTTYVHSQSMSFWTGRMAGQIKNQINYVSDGFGAVPDIVKSVFRALTIILNGALLLRVNRYVAYMFVGIIVLRVAYAWVMYKPLKTAAKDRSTAGSALSGKLVDSISNFSIVKLFARRSGEEKYLAPARTEYVQTRLRKGFLERMFWAIPGLLWDALFGVTLGLCAYLYMQGQMTVADVVVTTGVYFSVMGTISQLIDTLPNIIDKLGSAAKAYSELVVPIDVADAPDAPDLAVCDAKIEFKNVWFRYAKGRRWILRDFSLTINPGESVGLVGASGAGKTTLVNLLMRFYDVTRGQILIDGVDIRNVSQESLRRNIAFIPQEPTMFNRTLRENIEYGKMDATDAEIRRAAQRAAADKFINNAEKKYDTLVGDRGMKLSGGQRQRIAIARAFLKDAPILILDEATSALDSETEIAIQKSFEELASGRTTIAIAHRLSTLRNMDRIIVLRSGRIIEQGTHKTLVRRDGAYARLWKMQSGGFIQD
ncbi:ABC transporter ATP-binding protein [bacterium]|nr:ABC transporter ATP-binding protein [bacterium]